MNKLFSAAERSNDVVALRKQFVIITGSLGAGVLLSQIAYWFSGDRLRVKRGNRMWLAKRREDLACDCGLSFDQYKRAIKKLKGLGLVVVEQHKFAGNPISHLWLDQEALAHAVQSAPPVRSNMHHIGGAVAHCSYTETTNRNYRQSEADATYVAGEERGEIAQELVRAEPRPIDDWMAERPVLAEQKAGEFTAKEWLMKATGILKLHQGKMGLREVRLTANSLAIAWKRMVAERYGGFVKELTQKEIGQLRMYLQKVGDKAPEVMAAALDQWADFALEAKYQKGLSSTPERPVVGFLLQHHDVAMQLIAKPVPQPVPKIVVSPVVVEQVKSEGIQESFATIEDVMACLQILGRKK